MWSVFFFFFYIKGTVKLKITIITTLNLAPRLVISRRWADLFREKNAVAGGGMGVGQFWIK